MASSHASLHRGPGHGVLELKGPAENGASRRGQEASGAQVLPLGAVGVGLDARSHPSPGTFHLLGMETSTHRLHWQGGWLALHHGCHVGPVCEAVLGNTNWALPGC